MRDGAGECHRCKCGDIVIINGQVSKKAGGGTFTPIVITQTYNLLASGTSGSATLTAGSAKNIINQAVANLPDGNYHLKIFFIATNSPNTTLAMSNFIQYNNVAVTNGEIDISPSSITVYFRKSSAGGVQLTVTGVVQILEAGIE